MKAPLRRGFLQRRKPETGIFCAQAFFSSVRFLSGNKKTPRYPIEGSLLFVHLPFLFKSGGRFILQGHPSRCLRFGRTKYINLRLRRFSPRRPTSRRHCGRPPNTKTPDGQTPTTKHPVLRSPARLTHPHAAEAEPTTNPPLQRRPPRENPSRPCPTSRLGLSYTQYKRFGGNVKG